MAAPSPLRQLTLSLYLPSLLVALGQQGVLIMLPLYALELGGGPALAATLLGLRGLGTMFADLPAGMLISRFGDKRTMLGGLAVLVASLVAFVLTGSAWAAGALALAFGVGVGTWMLTRLHYIAEHCAESHRGRAMTVLAGIQRLGTFIGPILGGTAVEFLGYQALFVGAAGLALAGGALVAVYTRATAPEKLQTHNPIRAVARVVAARRGVLLRAGSAALTLQLIRSGRQLLVPLWGAYIGLDAAQIGVVFGLSSAIDMCMFYPAGYLMDSRGRKWAAVSSLLVIAGSLGLLALTGSLWSYTAVVLLSGVGNGFGTGVVMTIGADLSPRHLRGEFLGLWRLIGDVGHAVGPLVMGVAAEAFALSGVLVACAGIGAVGALIMTFAVEETLRRD